MEGEEVEVQVPATDEPPEPEEKPNTEGTPGAGEEPPPARATLDELLANPPDWLKANLTMLESSKNIDAADLAELDPNAQRVVAGLLLRAREAKPEIDDREKAIKDKEIELAARERMLLQRQSGNLRLLGSNPAARELLKMPEGQEPDDPYSDEGINYRVNKLFNERMQAFLDVFAKGEQDLKAAYEQAEAEAAAQAQHEATVAYVEANLDTFKDPRVEERVVELVQKHAFNVEQAHKMALREIAMDDEAVVKQTALEKSRDRIATGGRVQGVIPPTPEGEFLSPEVQAHYRRYPEALKRDYEKAFGTAPR